MSSYLHGYDIDGVLTIGVKPKEPYVVISGRTFSEYNDYVKQIASVNPVYIRGNGRLGDREHAGKFKAQMINLLGVREFYEDDEVQMQIIKKQCSTCRVFHVKSNTDIIEI